jgi:hypothetical protein
LVVYIKPPKQKEGVPFLPDWRVVLGPTPAYMRQQELATNGDYLTDNSLALKYWEDLIVKYDPSNPHPFDSVTKVEWSIRTTGMEERILASPNGVQGVREAAKKLHD